MDISKEEFLLLDKEHFSHEDSCHHRQYESIIKDDLNNLLSISYEFINILFERNIMFFKWLPIRFRTKMNFILASKLDEYFVIEVESIIHLLNVEDAQELLLIRPNLMDYCDDNWVNEDFIIKLLKYTLFILVSCII